MLSAVVFDYLRHIFKDQNRTVVYLCPPDSQVPASDPLTPRNLAGSLLKQLLQRSYSKDLSESLRRIYEVKENEGEPDVGVFCDILKMEITTFDRVYLIIDALDEYPKNLQDWLMNELMGLDPRKLSVMGFSRECEVNRAIEIWCDVCKTRNLNIYLQCKVCENFDVCRSCEGKGKRCEYAHELEQPGKVYFRVETAENDIKRYIRQELRKELEDSSLLHLDTRRYTTPPGTSAFGQMIHNNLELVDRIPDVIANKAHGNFRLAKDYWDSLKLQNNEFAIEVALEKLPDELYEHYKLELERLKTKKHRKYGCIPIKILSLVALANRHLRFAELQHALVMVLEPSATFHRSMVIGRKDMLAMTRQLITVDSDAIASVGFSDPIFRMCFTDYQAAHTEEGVTQAQLAQACLKYLSLQPMSQPRETLWAFAELEKKYPFVAYASQCWGDHVRLASDPDVETMALEFVQNPDNVAACAQAAWLTSVPGNIDCSDHRGASALHLCAWFNLPFMISRIDKECLSADIRESTYQKSPLMYACRRGHVDVVHQLLGLGASVNASSLAGTTPIFEAIVGDHEACVKILLRRGELQINTTNPEQFGRTALMVAVRLGRLGITQELLKVRDIDINAQDVDGHTALSIATAHGYGQIVQTLLEQDGIEVNLTTHAAGYSALAFACSRKSTNDCSMVRSLLDHGADLNLRDNNGGGTVIFSAIKNGFVLAFEVLLEYNADLHAVDDDGRGLLHWSTVEGILHIIRALSERGLQLDCQDRHGSTSLHEASRYGKLEAAKILLDLGADHRIKDHNGFLAIDVAWQYWELEIMNLLASKELDEQTQAIVTANEEQRPIWALAKAGRLSLCKELMAAGKIDFTQLETRTKSNALHFATLFESADGLSSLLENGTISPNDTDQLQRTPLHLAAIKGNFDATRILLNQVGIDPNCKDRWGDTPLSLARYFKRHQVAILLVEAHADMDVPNMSRNQQDLLLTAVGLGKVTIVQALINRGADVLGRNEDGEMAYDIAQTRHDGEMMHTLQSCSDFLRDASYSSKGTKRQRDSSIGNVPPTLRRRTAD